MWPLTVLFGAIASAPAPCTAPKIVHTAPFAIGESLEYDIDSLGATIGRLRMTVLAGKRPSPFLIEARGQTGSFASSFHPVDAVATTLLGRSLDASAYQETSTEDGVHRALDVSFPPVDGRLHIRSSTEGNRDDSDLHAPADARDLLAALYAVRGMSLEEGTEICLPVFAGRRLWTLRAKVSGKERARTPAGDFLSIRLTGTATRVDLPTMKRDVQFWLSEDPSHTPVAACGLIQNKPVCANLREWTPGRKKIPVGIGR